METESILLTSWPVASDKGFSGLGKGFSLKIDEFLAKLIITPILAIWNINAEIICQLGAGQKKSRNTYYSKAISVQSITKSINSAAEYYRAVSSLGSLTRPTWSLSGPTKALVLRFLWHSFPIVVLCVCTINSIMSDLIEWIFYYFKKRSLQEKISYNYISIYKVLSLTLSHLIYWQLRKLMNLRDTAFQASNN